ncbi:MAG: hypothetical protein VX755_10885, partial [Pseudomonadota bacterium]|nr:hypothetical protein [Pseudomonadota bacterium]
TLAEATPQGPVLYIGKLTLTQVAAWTGRLDGGGHSYLVHISARAVAADDFTVHTIDYIVTV